MLKLGRLELGPIPRIAVPLTDADLPSHADMVRRYADVVELRIDRFQRRDPTHVAEVCRAARTLQRPLIATVRASEEGGAVSLSDEERWALFAAVTPLVDAVDIELRAPIRDRVVTMARSTGALAIVSHHDFARTPSEHELAACLDAALLARAEVVKIATLATDAADSDRLLDFLRAGRARDLIVIGMGVHGVASRVFFPLIGSRLTYAFVDRATAPGQLSAAELHEALCRYSPAFAAAHPG